MNAAPDRFDELLPFYVNGTLAEADREWFDAHLRQHPQAAAELDSCRTLQARIRADVPAVAADAGLARAMGRIRSEAAAPQQQPRRAVQPSLLQRVGGWLSALLPQPLLKPAFAAALAVVAVQGIVIVQMAGEDDEASMIRSTPASVPVEQGPYLKVNFKGDARESDIRLLLVEVHGSLAAGPGQLGDYYVRVPAAQADAAAGTLKASAIVDAVAVVDALPARN
jgi:hypothetical protein